MHGKQRVCNSLFRRVSGGAMAALAIVSVYALPLVSAHSAQAQTYTVIHTFTGNDGAIPFAGLTMDSSGNLYGSTHGGGTDYNGTVFKLRHVGDGWILTPLHDFTGGNDGP